MARPIPTLAGNTPAEFPRAFRAWVVERIDAQAAAGRFGGQDRDHLAVVRGFVDYLAAEHQDPLDQLMVTLWAISQAMTEIGRQDGSIDGPAPGFCSTSGQRRILAVVGDAAHKPPPSMQQLLEEIVAAGTRDFADAVRVSRQHLREEVVAEKDAATAARSEAEGLRVDHGVLENLRAENEAKEQDLEERDAIIRELQIQLGQQDVKRRTKIETGIYRSPAGAFEVSRPKSAKGGAGFERADSLDHARLLRAEYTGEDPIGQSGSSEAAPPDLDDALDVREKELGRELTDEEIDAVGAEFQSSTGETKPREEV